MSITQIPRNSRWFPLPPDYPDLTEPGKRQARVNACRLWLSRDKGYWGPDLLPACVNFFDAAYLRQDEGWFYPHGMMRPNPSFHSDILSAIADNRYTLIAAPRDAAKSTLLYKMMLTMLASAPLWNITYGTSTNRNVKKCMGTLMRVLRRNKPLNEDFGPEYGGRVIPSRGDAPFGIEEMNLANGSRLFGTSVESRNRGDRPHLLVLDDIEYDGRASTNLQLRREDVEDALFSVFLPMIQQEGSRGVMIGTTITRRHYLVNALQVDEAGRAKDPRFDGWFRWKLKALYLPPEEGESKPPVISNIRPYLEDARLASQLHSLWPDRYSVSEYLRIAQDIGPDRFMAEYMSDPNVADGQFFALDERHNYHIEDADEFIKDAPWRSEARIVYTDTKGVTQRTPLRKFLAENLVVQTVDWALSVSASSDYSAIATMAITPQNQAFVMDLWAGKVIGSALASKVIAEAQRWRPRAVGVEAPSIEFHIAHHIKTGFEGLPDGTTWKPVVKPLKHFSKSKSERIEGLHYRFGDHGGTAPVLLLCPWKQRGTEPTFRMLREQIEGFSPMVADGNLANDDCIDAVAMLHSVLPGLPRQGSKPPPPRTILDRLTSGETHDEDGIPLIEQVDSRTLTSPIIRQIIEAQETPQPSSNI